jgi:hypothetical protein
MSLFGKTAIVTDACLYADLNKYWQVTFTDYRNIDEYYPGILSMFASCIALGKGNFWGKINGCSLGQAHDKLWKVISGKHALAI